MGKEIFFGATLLIFLGCNSGKVNNGAGGAGGTPQDLLKGIVTSVPPDTPEMLASKKAKLEENLATASEAAAKGDYDGAIALLEESLGLDSKHREILNLLIKTSRLRSREVQAEDPARSYRLIVQAGGYIQVLRDAYKELTKDERDMIASVMFDEACAHARSNRHSEFTGAFNAAIDAGFADLDRLNSEPDLEQFRKVPELGDLIRNATEAIAKRNQNP